VYFPHVTESVRRGMSLRTVCTYCTGGAQYVLYCTVGTVLVLYSTPFSVWTRPFGLSAVLVPSSSRNQLALTGKSSYCRVTQAQRAGESASQIHQGRVRFGEGGRRDWWDPVYLFRLRLRATVSRCGPGPAGVGTITVSDNASLHVACRIASPMTLQWSRQRTGGRDRRTHWSAVPPD
jgi:hypothetical protein